MQQSHTQGFVRRHQPTREQEVECPGCPYRAYKPTDMSLPDGDAHFRGGDTQARTRCSDAIVAGYSEFKTSANGVPIDSCNHRNGQLVDLATGIVNCEKGCAGGFWRSLDRSKLVDVCPGSKCYPTCAGDDQRTNVRASELRDYPL